MIQNYFECQGERYNSGDTFYINWYGKYSKVPSVIEAKFVNCDTETKQYTFVPKDYLETSFPEELFFKCFRSKAYVSELRQPREPRKATLKEELSIDSLLIAWVWYIIIMAAGVLFFDRLMIWIFASLIFFSYRNNKLKERGYK